DNNATQAVVPRAQLAPAAAAIRHTTAAPARKAIAPPKTAGGKSASVARPKPKSGEDGEWQEF
ncbi:MAG: hypothetical protein KKH12_01865, partial [Gammaproteobacteria bacterium]|nr:hypothetical protein [Gammaproteobacteria bacterium]MBU1480400.1 hypothetical protein [Gammaproteobacteria bacterium]